MIKHVRRILYLQVELVSFALKSLAWLLLQRLEGLLHLLNRLHVLREGHIRCSRWRKSFNATTVGTSLVCLSMFVAKILFIIPNTHNLLITLPNVSALPTLRLLHSKNLQISEISPNICFLLLQRSFFDLVLRFIITARVITHRSQRFMLLWYFLYNLLLEILLCYHELMRLYVQRWRHHLALSL